MNYIEYKQQETNVDIDAVNAIESLTFPIRPLSSCRRQLSFCSYCRGIERKINDLLLIFLCLLFL